MRVWILQTGEPLHCDKGDPRPMRAMNLANELVAQGISVELWGAAFNHQSRRHRTRRFESIRVNELLTIHLIPSMGYRQNIGLGRLIDHAQMGYRLWKLLRSGRFEKPDIAFVGYPPIELAWVMLRWLKGKGVPSFIDVKDQWPIIFIRALPRALQPLAKIILVPYFLMAKFAMRDATAITSMSEPFLNWSLKFCGRPRQPYDAVIPLVPPPLPMTDRQIKDARLWWLAAGLDLQKDRCFTFVGSLSAVFDFSALRGAMDDLLLLHPECKVVLCGSGAEEHKVKSLFANLPNVMFPGWVDAPKITVLMSVTVGTIAPYRNLQDFQLSVPNKVLDSFMFCQPVVTSLQGMVSDIITRAGVGIVCSDDSEGWFAALCCLLEDPELRRSMSSRAGLLYEEQFNVGRVYGELVNNIKTLAENMHEGNLNQPKA
jgi:glycosyltransferase involved in cell wall biosynthesis